MDYQQVPYKKLLKWQI